MCVCRISAPTAATPASNFRPSQTHRSQPLPPDCSCGLSQSSGLLFVAFDGVESELIREHPSCVANHGTVKDASALNRSTQWGKRIEESPDGAGSCNGRIPGSCRRRRLRPPIVAFPIAGTCLVNRRAHSMSSGCPDPGSSAPDCRPGVGRSRKRRIIGKLFDLRLR
jgi:hypothetical protein